MNIVPSPPGNSGFSPENPIPGNLFDGITPGIQSFGTVLDLSSTNGQAEATMNPAQLIAQGTGSGDKPQGQAPGSLTGIVSLGNSNPSRILHGIETEIPEAKPGADILPSGELELSAGLDQSGLTTGDLLQAAQLPGMLVIAPVIPWLVPVPSAINNSAVAGDGSSIEVGTANGSVDAKHVTTHEVTINQAGPVSLSRAHSFLAATEPSPQAIANTETKSRTVSEQTVIPLAPVRVDASDMKRDATPKAAGASVDPAPGIPGVSPTGGLSIDSTPWSAGVSLQPQSPEVEKRTKPVSAPLSNSAGIPVVEIEGSIEARLAQSGNGVVPVRSVSAATPKVLPSGHAVPTDRITAAPIVTLDAAVSLEGNAELSRLKVPIPSNALAKPIPLPLGAPMQKDLEDKVSGTISLRAGGVLEILGSDAIPMESVTFPNQPGKVLVSKELSKSILEKSDGKAAAIQSSAARLGTVAVPSVFSKKLSSPTPLSSQATRDFVQRAVPSGFDVPEPEVGDAGLKTVAGHMPERAVRGALEQSKSQEPAGASGFSTVRSKLAGPEAIVAPTKPAPVQSGLFQTTTVHPAELAVPGYGAPPSTGVVKPGRNSGLMAPGSGVSDNDSSRGGKIGSGAPTSASRDLNLSGLRSGAEGQSMTVPSRSSSRGGDGELVPGKPVGGGKITLGEHTATTARVDQKGSAELALGPNRLDSGDVNALTALQLKNRSEISGEVSRAQPQGRANLDDGEPTEVQPGGIVVKEPGSTSVQGGNTQSEGEPDSRSQGQGEMFRDSGNRQLDPRAESPRIGRSTNSGTGDAQQNPGMAVSVKYNSEGEASGKNLPVAGRIDTALTARGQELPPVDAEHTRVDSATSSAFLVPGQGSGRIAVRNSEGPGLAEGQSSLAQNLAEGVWTAVETFRSQGGEDWIVRLRPDSESAIQLKLKFQDNQLVIHAKVESGNTNLMAASWTELQTVLSERGIQLKPLETDFGNLNGGFHHGANGFVTSDQDSRNARTDRSPLPESERPAVPQSKPKPESKEPRRSNQMLETWA